ncbi:MAG: zf-TFIIB domain-containing protein [Acidobacteria bacterium]|nr:zf-TFIIB domain-containing protein [Acidobacteriota bacterium]
MPVKPTTQEDAFFAQQEAERRAALARAQADRARAREKESRRQQHWMRCPKCGDLLTEISYRDQRVDRCDSCGGVWLDAGEMEALALKEGGFLWGLRKVFQG